MASFITWLIWGSAAQGQQAQVQEPSSTVASRTVKTAELLEDREEQLKKKRDQLELRMEAEQENARKCLATGDKKRALECLKKKKMLSTQVESIDNMIMRVIEQKVAMESQATTLAVVSSLHQAALTAKQNLKTASIEKVEKVMEDIADTNDELRQMQEALAAPTGMAAALDNDELLNELDELDELDALEEAEAEAPQKAKPGKGRAAAAAAKPAPAARAKPAPARKAAAAAVVDKAEEEEEERAEEAVTAELAA